MDPCSNHTAHEQRIIALEARMRKVEEDKGSMEKRMSDQEKEGAVMGNNVDRIFELLDKMEKSIVKISGDIEVLKSIKGKDAIEKLKTQRTLIYSVAGTVIAAMILYYFKSRGM